MRHGKLTLKWDFNEGEGSIGNIESFRSLDPLLRCDVLSDWICGLNEEHEQAEKDFMDYLKTIRDRSV